MTRAEHLAWARRRALEYVDVDQPQHAVASLMSDLTKHPETNPLLPVSTITVSLAIAMYGDLNDTRRWVMWMTEEAVYNS